MSVASFVQILCYQPLMYSDQLSFSCRCRPNMYAALAGGSLGK
jgi:hypothetical protein